MNTRPFTFLDDWYFWIFYMNRAIQTELGTLHIASGRDVVRRRRGTTATTASEFASATSSSPSLFISRGVSVCVRKRAV